MIKKQVLKSEKKRSIVYLTRFAFKNKSIFENVCDYLLLKEDEHADSFMNIKQKFSFTNKQFKTIIQNGERSGAFNRFIALSPIQVKANGKLITKNKETRMLKLSAKHLATMKLNDSLDFELNEANESLMDAEFTEDLCAVSSIGCAQLNTTPLYTQILARIEETGKDGISVKKLGTLFGFDFYKSRRLGTNLQTYPDLLTIMKETRHCRAKFQTLVMRKFLNLNDKIKPLEPQAIEDPAKTEVVSGEQDKTAAKEIVIEPVMTIVKRDNQSVKTIQAIMPDRMMSRKKIILSYLEKHRICTKYEMDKEIRRIEIGMILLD